MFTTFFSSIIVIVNIAKKTCSNLNSCDLKVVLLANSKDENTHKDNLITSSFISVSLSEFLISITTYVSTRTHLVKSNINLKNSSQLKCGSNISPIIKLVLQF